MGGPPAAAGPLTPTQRRRHVEDFEALKRIIAEAEEDVRKAEGGNKAAGTRVRKAMQDLKNAAQTVRQKVLEFRVEEK